MDLKEYLLDVGKKKDVKDELRELLGEEAQNVGLIVSQRVVNFPPQLLPHLYDALFDEISWATEDEVRWELCDKRYSYFFFMLDMIFMTKLSFSILLLEAYRGAQDFLSL